MIILEAARFETILSALEEKILEGYELICFCGKKINNKREYIAVLEKHNHIVKLS